MNYVILINEFVLLIQKQKSTYQTACYISYFIFHISYFIFHISYFIFHISYLISHISYLISHISYLTSYFSLPIFYLSIKRHHLREIISLNDVTVTLGRSDATGKTSPITHHYVMPRHRHVITIVLALPLLILLHSLTLTSFQNK